MIVRMGETNIAFLCDLSNTNVLKRNNMKAKGKREKVIKCFQISYNNELAKENKLKLSSQNGNLENVGLAHMYLSILYEFNIINLIVICIVNQVVPHFS